MELNDSLQKFIDSCGGEDLIRYLLKDEGNDNWENLILHPIVAWSPPHIDEPIVVGISVEGEVFSSKWDFNEYPEFQKWIDYIMEMGKYDSPIDALIDHKRALIPDEEDIMDAEMMGWKKVMQQVLDGERISTIMDNEEFTTELESFFSIIDHFMTTIGYTNINKNIHHKAESDETEDFSNEFKLDWA